MCEICHGKQCYVCVLLPAGLGTPGCAGAEGLICPPEPSSNISHTYGDHTDTYSTDRRLSDRTAAKQSTTISLPITLVNNDELNKTDKISFLIKRLQRQFLEAFETCSVYSHVK